MTISLTPASRRSCSSPRLRWKTVPLRSIRSMITSSRVPRCVHFTTSRLETAPLYPSRRYSPSAYSRSRSRWLSCLSISLPTMAPPSAPTPAPISAPSPARAGVRECSNYVFFFKKHRIDRLGDRHFDAVALGELPHALRRRHALGDAVHRIEDLLELASLADALADGAVAAFGADARGDQIAQPGK